MGAGMGMGMAAAGCSLKIRLAWRIENPAEMASPKTFLITLTQRDLWADWSITISKHRVGRPSDTFLTSGRLKMAKYVLMELSDVLVALYPPSFYSV